MVNMNLLETVLKLQNSDNYESSIKTILNHREFSQIEKVKFALHCAKDLDKYYDYTKYPTVKETRDKCLELIADYILNPHDKDIVNKLNAAANAAYAAAYAANAAANAAYAAYAAAYAAYAAANAANAAYAAYAAAYAAYAAANAAKYKELFNYITEQVFSIYNLNKKEELVTILYCG